MIGEAGYETSEESSDFKDVREMRADKTQTWLSAGFGDDSPHEYNRVPRRRGQVRRAPQVRQRRGNPLLCPLRGRAGDTLLRAKRRREDDIRLPQPDSRSLTRREGRRRPLRVKS